MPVALSGRRVAITEKDANLKRYVEDQLDRYRAELGTVVEAR